MSPPGGAAAWRGACPQGQLKKKVSRDDGRGGRGQDREAARPVTSSRPGEWSGGGLKIDRVGRTFFLPAPVILHGLHRSPGRAWRAALLSSFDSGLPDQVG